MRGTAVVDRRVVALLLAACLAAVGLSVTSASAARADASTLYTLLNQSRQAAGLPLLVRDSRLDAVAQSWTGSMSSRKKLGHNPSYSTQIPSGWTKAGENVAGGYATDAATHQAWMNSAGHKANILGAYTSVGIGWVKAADGGIWATQVFAAYPGVKPPVTGSTTLTDVTGDVKTDLVGVNSAGRLVIMPGNGSGGLERLGAARLRLVGDARPAPRHRRDARRRVRPVLARHLRPAVAVPRRPRWRLRHRSRRRGTGGAS